MTDVQEETQEPKPLLPPLPAELRDDLLALVLSDLLGPAGGAEEELSESVRERYLIGILAPRKQQEHIDPATQDDTFASGDDNAEDGPMDQSVSQAPTLFPSSFGMTCCVAFDYSGGHRADAKLTE